MKSDSIFNTLYASYPALEVCKNAISDAFVLLLNAARANAIIMICGNGGSAADSEHIVGELMKGFMLKRELPKDKAAAFSGIDGGEEIAKKLQGSIKAISLTSQTGLISAFCNDVDASLVYAQQVLAYAEKKEEVLLALSTSGNSLNIVNAVKTAKAAGIISIAITGKNDSKLSHFSDVCIKLPSDETFKVQEYTLPVYHALCAALEAEMFM